MLGEPSIEDGYGTQRGFSHRWRYKAKLIVKDKRSAELIKPFVKGDDVRRWRIENKDRWMIVTPIGTKIAITRHICLI